MLSARRSAGGRDRQVQRRCGVPADRAGNAGAARPAHCADSAADRLPHLRGDDDSARARHHGRGDSIPPPLPPRRADRRQHDHAAARLDDRDRCRYRLLAVHRHALPPTAARRHGTGGRGRRSRRLGRQGGAVRRPDGRDLRERPRHLRSRLRDEARHRLRARRPHHRADRELAADRSAREARAQDRPAEDPVPAPARRLGRGAGRRLPSPAGAGSSRETRRSCSRWCSWWPWWPRARRL